MMMKEMRFFFGMLKEALKIPFRNPNFVVFSFLTSLPLFTFMLINDFIIQQTLIQTAKILTQTLHPKKFFDFYETPLGLIERAIEEVSHKLLLGFIYLGVVHFLDFLNTVAIVDSASIIHKGETPMNLMDMLCRPMKEIRFKGPLITSIYTFILASFVFLALLIKSVEWSAIWNMSIVISVLEEKHGDVALVLSSYHSRGSRQFGSLFMLVFFVWSFALRGSCLYMGWSGGGNGIRITSAYVGLVCLGNTMKWLVFVVYLHNCKNQRLERVDPEVGRAAEAVKEGYDQGSSTI
ncbi:hypothetical protein CK203_009322 [Vitis vinifera]|uniref:Uncharacterized protein n=1 Tax=Vitis vinifera TaxID=29760 RepID=A0A438K332_VITVI|nr:hypothetical protein CK203_009322 [Vitis vinifera]